MIYTFKHASKNFRDTRTKKITNGNVLTISQLNAWKIMDYLDIDDCNYLVKHDSRIYYLSKPLLSSGRSERVNWNKIVDVRYNSGISENENRLMLQHCGINKSFLHESFKFVL
jgi:hypothetical protein